MFVVKPNPCNNVCRRSPLHWATVCEKPEAIRALTTAGGMV